MWKGSSGEVAGTLDSHYFKGCGEREGVEREIVYRSEMYCVGNGQLDQLKLQDKVGALNCMHDQQAVIRRGEKTLETVRRLTPLECERLQGYPDYWTLIGEPEEVEVKDYDIKYDEEGNEVEKTLIGSHKEIEYFYTDSEGKRRRCADSARYKALGNSIALPWWQWLAKRISAEYEQPVTIGSLFDGIGGFPLVFSRAGGIPVWASEIEPFCIEVTKRRFG